jgi:hypothetical protein
MAVGQVFVGDTENERKLLASMNNQLLAVVEVFADDWSARNGLILEQTERFYHYMDNFIV